MKHHHQSAIMTNTSHQKASNGDQRCGRRIFRTELHMISLQLCRIYHPESNHVEGHKTRIVQVCHDILCSMLTTVCGTWRRNLMHASLKRELLSSASHNQMGRSQLRNDCVYFQGYKNLIHFLRFVTHSHVIKWSNRHSSIHSLVAGAVITRKSNCYFGWSGFLVSGKIFVKIYGKISG